VLLEYTGTKVVGGKPVRQHLSTAMLLAEMASVISVGRAAFLELNHQFDHPEIYGPRITRAHSQRHAPSRHILPGPHLS